VPSASSGMAISTMAQSMLMRGCIRRRDEAMRERGASPAF
jgi:hypothetical protein